MAEEALTELARAGFGRWEEIPIGEKGGRPTRRFVLDEAVTATETPENLGNEEVSVTTEVDSANPLNDDDWGEV